MDANWEPSLTLLPPEILEQIFVHVSPRYLLPLMLTAYGMKNLIHQEHIWKRMYQMRMPQTALSLSLSPAPEYWQYTSPGSMKFVYLYDSIHDDSSLFEDVMPSSGKKEFPDELFYVMRVIDSNPNNLNIQKAASYILRRLAYFPTDATNAYRSTIQTFRKVVGELGAVEALMANLTRFPDSPQVLAGSLCALGNLAIDSANSKAFVDGDGLGTVIKLMRRHKEQFSVLDYGCFLMSNIDEIEESFSVVYKSGAGKLAMEFVQENLDDPVKLTPPLNLLSVLSLGEECKDELGPELMTILRFLFQKFSKEEGAKELVITLLNLAICLWDGPGASPLRKLAIDLEFIEIGFSELKIFKSDGQVFAKASLFLFSLLWYHIPSEIEKLRRDLIKIVILGMKDFPDDVPLQRCSAAMLADFASSDSELKRYIVGMDGVPLIKRAISLRESRPASTEDDNHFQSVLVEFARIF